MNQIILRNNSLYSISQYMRPFFYFLEKILRKLLEKSISNSYRYISTETLNAFSLYNTIICLGGLTYFLSSLFSCLGPYMFVVVFLDYYLCKHYNISILLFIYPIIGRFKYYISILIQINVIIGILFLSNTNNIFFILGLIILIFIKVYINIINKNFRLIFPLLYYLINSVVDFLLLLSISIVFMLPGGFGGPGGSNNGGGNNEGGPKGVGPNGDYPLVGKERRKRTNYLNRAKCWKMLSEEEFNDVSKLGRNSPEQNVIKHRAQYILKYKEWLYREIHGKKITPKRDAELKQKADKLKDTLFQWKYADRNYEGEKKWLK